MPKKFGILGTQTFKMFLNLTFLLTITDPSFCFVSTMPAKSLGTFHVIYAIDKLQNPLPRKTMFVESHMTSTIGRNDAFPSG